MNSSVVCHGPTYNQTVMSGRILIRFVDFSAFHLFSIAFVEIYSGCFWCETGAVKSRRSILQPEGHGFISVRASIFC